MEHVENLEVHVAVHADRDSTSAKAVLHTGGHTVRGFGEAHRRASDFDVPEIGVELAVGRALLDLGGRLILTTAEDIGSIEGRAVSVRG